MKKSLKIDKYGSGFAYKDFRRHHAILTSKKLNRLKKQLLDMKERRGDRASISPPGLRK